MAEESGLKVATQTAAHALPCFYHLRGGAQIARPPLVCDLSCREICSPSGLIRPCARVWFSSPGLGSSESLQPRSEALGNWEDNRWHVERPH